MSEQPGSVHPLIFYLPAIVVIAVAIGIGAYFVIASLDDSGPKSTISESDARDLARSAYDELENNTVDDAVCDAKEYLKDADTWRIECQVERDGRREITVWAVTPDGVALHVDTRFEGLETGTEPS